MQSMGEKPATDVDSRGCIEMGRSRPFVRNRSPCAGCTGIGIEVDGMRVGNR